MTLARNSKTDIEVKLRVVKKEFEQDLRDVNNALKRARRDFQYGFEADKHFMSEGDRLAGSVAKYSEQLAIQSKGLEKARSHYDSLTDAQKANSAVAEEMANRIDAQTHKYNQLANKLYEAEVAMVSYNSSFGKAGRFLENVGGKVERFGTATQMLGQSMLPLSVGVVGIGKKAYDEFTRFESGIAGVRKTTDMTQQQLESFKGSIRDLATETPHTVEQFAKVAEIGGQLGIEYENLLPFAKTMLDLSVTTNLELEDGSLKLAQFANIMRMSQGDFDRLGSSIVDLGNNFATQENDIVSMGHRLAGAGRQLGMSVGDVLALSTATAATGAQIESGGSNLSKMLIEMQLAVELGTGSIIDANAELDKYGITMEEVVGAIEAGDDAVLSLAESYGVAEEDMYRLTALVSDQGLDLANLADVAGMTAEEFSNLFKQDAGEAFVQFIEGMAELETQGQSTVQTLDDLGIKNIRQRDVLLRLVGAHDQLRSAMEMGNDAFEANTALTEEAEKRYETTASKMQVLKNKISDTFIDIGERLAPYLTEAVDKVDELIGKWDELSDTQKDSIIKFAGAIALLGPGLTTIGMMTKGLGGLIKMTGGALKGVGDIFATMKVVKPAVQGASKGIKGLGKVAGGTAPSLVSASKGAGALATKLGLLAGIKFLAIGAGIAGIGIAVKKTVDKLNEESLQPVDLFADKVTMVSQGEHIVREVEKITEETKEALGAYMTVREDFNTAMTHSRFRFDEENTETMRSSLEQQAQMLKASYEERQQTLLDHWAWASEHSRARGSIEEWELEEHLIQLGEAEQRAMKDKYDRINSLIRQAEEEKRQLTREEHAEMQRLLFELDQEAIDNLSKTEGDKAIIRERLADYGRNQTAKNLAEILRISQESYAEEIALAEEKYNGIIAKSELLRQAGDITKEQYDTMVDTARSAKDQSIYEAEEMMIGVLRELREVNPDIVKELDLQEGTIKTNWEKIKETLTGGRTESATTIDEMIAKHREYSENARKSLSEVNQENLNHRRNVGDTFDNVERDVRGGIVGINEYNALRLQDKSSTITIRTIRTDQTIMLGNRYMATSYASGIDYVRQSGTIAQLHEGERVLTKAENKSYSRASMEELAKTITGLKDSIKSLGHERNNETQKIIKTDRDLPAINVNIANVSLENDRDYEEMSYRIGREIRKSLAYGG